MRRLLSNPFSVGILRWEGRDHAGAHEPLVSRETFHACERMLEKRKVSHTRHAADEFTFRGVAWCTDCDRRMTI